MASLLSCSRMGQGQRWSQRRDRGGDSDDVVIGAVTVTALMGQFKCDRKSTYK